MDEAEFDQKFPEIFRKIEGIHTREKLAEFCMKVQDESIDLFANVPYRYMYVEDFEDDTSLLVTLAHHAFTDGIQYLGGMRLISDNYKQ